MFPESPAPILGCMSLRCLIIDDSPEFSRAARALLEQQGIEVVGVAASAQEAVRRVEEARPDVTLVDIDLNGDSGFALVRTLKAEDDSAGGQLIMISSHAEDEFAELIEASPAIGFVAKSDLSAEAIRALLR
ncbi:MAG: putative transcriptional regulator [Solirubrobacterales bacterium]|nr:putative transcriptional regulator [Solirubrobacterales bacterium]